MSITPNYPSAQPALMTQSQPLQTPSSTGNTKPLLSLKKTLLMLTTSFTLGLIFATAIAYTNNPPTSQLISPLATITKILGKTTNSPKGNKIVYGFLPYWQFKSQNTIQYNLLTHLAIFGVDIDKNGNFKKLKDGYQEPGWTALNSSNFNHIRRQARAAGTKVILVLRSFDADTIDSIIFSPQNTQNLINQTLALVDEKNFDGINIDFEYAANTPPNTAAHFTKFVNQLTQSLKAKNPALHVSIDVFANSSQGNKIWQIKPLSKTVDNIIVMAYDYHRPSSQNAGPIAPLYGADSLWPQDITTSFSQFSKLADPQKFILGVPYYGYQWQTVSANHLSNTFPNSGATATYQRIQKLINNQNTQINWDSSALAPWLSYQDGGATWQIYYENERSLGFKYDFVNQAGLDGIAIWALGYDTGYTALWQLIDNKFF